MGVTAVESEALMAPIDIDLDIDLDTKFGASHQAALANVAR